MEKIIPSLRRVQINTPLHGDENGDEESNQNAREEPFQGNKMRRKASLKTEYKGDYLNVSSNLQIQKFLDRLGDNNVVFSDEVLKFTASGKMKRRILLITNSSVYFMDPKTFGLKRRIILTSVHRLCLSKLNDNFFAIIIPSEYDCLMASTRKTEIITVLVEATKNSTGYELEVACSNRFQYNAGANLVKILEFEQIDEGVRTKFSKK